MVSVELDERRAKGDLNAFNEVQDVARLCDGIESVDFTSVLSPTIVARSTRELGSSAMNSRLAGLAEPNDYKESNNGKC